MLDRNRNSLLCISLNAHRYNLLPQHGCAKSLLRTKKSFYPLFKCGCSVSFRLTACTIRTKTRWRCARLCARCTKTAQPSKRDLKLVSARSCSRTRARNKLENISDRHKVKGGKFPALLILFLCPHLCSVAQQERPTI